MAAKKPQGRRKHVPMRRCIACRHSFPKRVLVRIILSPERGLVVDPSGKMAGRGAYLCQDPLCWEKTLVSEDLLSRALNSTVSSDARMALSAYFEQELKNKPGHVAEG